MDFTQAYLGIVEASIEQDQIEIPSIIKTIKNWKGYHVLDVNPKYGARLAIKLAKALPEISHITCLEKKPEIIDSINQAIRQEGLEKRVSVTPYEGEKFPLEDNLFDLAYTAWGNQQKISSPQFLAEMTRVSKQVLLVMPGIGGDEPIFRSIVLSGEEEARKHYQQDILEYFKAINWQAKYQEGVLRLKFPSLQRAYEVLSTLNFGDNVPEHKKSEIESFLKTRYGDFKDGFYILHARK